MRKGIWAGKIFIRWCRLFFEDYIAAEILKIIVGSLFFRLPSLYEEDVLDVHISRSAVF